MGKPKSNVNAQGIVMSSTSAPAAHHQTFGNVPGMHKF